MKLNKILLLVGLCFVIDNVQAENPAPLQVVTGEYVVAIKNEILADRAVSMLEQVAHRSLAVTDANSGIGVKVINLNEQKGKSERVLLDKENNLCAKLRKLERRLRQMGQLPINRNYAAHCDPNGILQSDGTPNDQYYSLLWGMQRMSMPSAWDYTTGSSSLIVAIIDTGINYNHPDLAANIWTNTKEIPGNGIDDDGDGVIDDVHGYNAITDSGDPMDDNGHGTHCAGTIGGVGNNGTGVAGINWNVKLLPVKFLSSSGSGSLWDAVKALQYVRKLKDRGEPIVLSSNSWGGGGYYQTLYDEINASRNSGLLFVAAAGNSGINSDASPQYPAAYDLDNIVSVAAIDSNGAIASFSNYGATTVDIGAPGVGISSTWFDGSYKSLSGTSMATPHVSGALALFKAYSGALTASQLKAVLLNSALPNSSLAGKVLSNGELNPLGGLQQLVKNPYSPTPIATSTPTITPTLTPTATITPIPPTPTSTPIPLPGVLTVLAIDAQKGIGIGQANISVKQGSTVIASGVTGNDGKFITSQLTGGVYQVVVSKVGLTFDSTVYTVTVNQATALTARAYSAGYSLKVKVVDRSDASSINAALVSLFVDGTLYGTGQTDATGYVTFSAPYGASYRVDVIQSDFYPQSITGQMTGRVERLVALAGN